MKIKNYQLIITALICLLPLSFLAGFTIKHQDNGYFIDHEKDVEVEQEGSHNGGGKTTAFLFFDKVKNAKMTFRKRILHPGSSIGYHLQKEQEIYYILNGDGELQMNGKTIPVTTGDTILTMPGSSHGLKPAGNSDMTVLLAYENN